jgi:hypothetical protein
MHCLLSVHSWSQLSHHCYHSFPFASSAFNHCFCIRTTNSIAFSTESLSFYFEFKFLSNVQIFQSDVKNFRNWLHLFLLPSLFPSSTPHSHHVKDILKARGLGPVAQSFFSILVIQLPLFSVTENFICNSNFLKL